MAAPKVGGLIFVTFTIVILIQSSASNENPARLMSRLTEQTVDRIEIDVRDHLTPTLKQPKVIGRLIEAGGPLLEGRQCLGDLLARAIASWSQIASTTNWDSELQQFGIVREEGIRPQISQ